MKIRLSFDVDVDEAAYAREYGLDGAAVRADAAQYVPALLGAEVQAKAAQLGYMTAAVATGEVLS